MTKSSFLKKFVEENVGSDHFEQSLHDLAKENFTLSKKLAKIFLKAFSST